MALFPLSLHGVGGAHQATHFLVGITHSCPPLLAVKCSLRNLEPSGYVHDPERTLLFLLTNKVFTFFRSGLLKANFFCW